MLLTIIFVMLAEILIFVPSVARFRETYLQTRLERAQIASLTLLARDVITEDLAAELLENAEVYNVALRRDEVSELILWSPLPAQIYATYDLRDATLPSLIRDAMMVLFDPEPRVYRIIDEPVKQAGTLIEITLPSAPLRAEMIDFGKRILLLSAWISIFTAALLFLSVRALIVRPMENVVRAMTAYAKAPEDRRRILTPSAKVVELRGAEEALSSLQKELTGALRQKQRLAELGEAVAKISHDLRNILTSAQLFTDRIEQSEDPTVARTAPKLVGSIQRAVNLCESALSYGKAQEPEPKLTDVSLRALVLDVIETESLMLTETDVTLTADIPSSITLKADPEQLHRALSNLTRNAAQAMIAARRTGAIHIKATQTVSTLEIRVTDCGPGVPEKAQDDLLKPFKGSLRKGGTGLGLAISSELIKGHGGTLVLEKTGEDGSVFTISLPRS